MSDKDVAIPPDPADLIPTQPTVTTERPLVEQPPTHKEDSHDDLALTLDDGGETIGISRSGELMGYGSIRSNYRSLIRTALANGRLTIPNLGDLQTPAGVLMGDDSSTAGSFRVNFPSGKVIDSDTPTFSWQPVPGAESYVVEIFDQSFNNVASSGQLKNTSWKSKLARGRTYTWQVTAVSDGKIFRAPQRPQTEARFRIVDQKTSFELLGLRRSHPRSHLLLGTSYANAGLIDEAIHEFEMLSRQNPGDDLPRRFIRQLKDSK